MKDKTRKQLREMFVSIYEHPSDKKITLELGKVNASEMIYRYDKGKKEFREVGYPKVLEFIKLPRPMNQIQWKKWIKKQQDIVDRCVKYSRKLKGD